MNRHKTIMVQTLKSLGPLNLFGESQIGPDMRIVVYLFESMRLWKWTTTTKVYLFEWTRQDLKKNTFIMVNWKEETDQIYSRQNCEELWNQPIYEEPTSNLL